MDDECCSSGVVFGTSVVWLFVSDMGSGIECNSACTSLYCSLWPWRHLSSCDSHMLNIIPELIWSKLYSTRPKNARVNFSLTQVSLSLQLTAVPVCLCNEWASQPLNTAISFTSLWIFLFIVVCKALSLDFAYVENLTESCPPFDLIFFRSLIFLSSCL